MVMYVKNGKCTVADNWNRIHMPEQFGSSEEVSRKIFHILMNKLYIQVHPESLLNSWWLKSSWYEFQFAKYKEGIQEMGLLVDNMVVMQDFMSHVELSWIFVKCLFD